MRVERRTLATAEGHILVHNVVDATGRRVVRKGTRLDRQTLRKLAALGMTEVMVAVLDADDVHEDEAARVLAEALLTPELFITWGVGGRANLHSEVLGVVYVDGARVRDLNLLPGITLATVPPYTVVRPEEHRGLVATLKIIPFAVPRRRVEAARDIISASSSVIQVRPLRAARVALLLTGHPSALPRLRAQFEPPTRRRLERLGSVLATVLEVEQQEEIIARHVDRLLRDHELLIISGQTSVMDQEDLTLRALRRVGAEVTVHGAPVDPGNLLALAYRDERAILCAPGCARSPARNVVDLVLPRLLVGERLTQVSLAELGVGGLLHR